MKNSKFTLCLLIIIGICLTLSISKAEAHYTDNPLNKSEFLPTNHLSSNLLMGTPLRFILEYYGFKMGWNDGPTVVPISSSKTTPVAIPVLMYHILIPGRNDSISVDPVSFKEQMLSLKSAGYTTITELELLAHLEEDATLPDKPILITFDDGYISNYSIAFPILKELNMKASIYVIASRIFETNGVTAGEYEKLSWQQAREMVGTMSIQSHTWDSHSKQPDFQQQDRGLITSRLFTDNKLETQQEFEDRTFTDLSTAKNTIEKNVGTQVVAISYPYGEYTEDTIRLAKKAGYKMAFTIHNGTNNQYSSPFELKRITADGKYSGEELIQLIESD
ncbi:MAG: polysaccharide deacetylase family protein [Planococcus donghaensis]